MTRGKYVEISTIHRGYSLIKFAMLIRADFDMGYKTTEL